MDRFQWLRRWRMRGSSAKQIFSGIYGNRTWRGVESVSGRGSDQDQTAILRSELPTLLKDLGIAALLDLPCGDFHWMREVIEAAPGITYLGGDIVDALIDANLSKYRRAGINFMHIDLLADPLPPADMVLCRDCLVHLSEADIRLALRNIAASSFEFVALTTFTSCTRNKDIRTGRWRPLNLQIAPFNFPPPLRLINEKCTEEGGRFSDKSIGIWRLGDVKL